MIQLSTGKSLTISQLGRQFQQPICTSPKPRHTNPDPTVYKPDLTLTRKSAPSFTFSQKHKNTEQHLELGPGEYNPRLQSHSKLISLSGRHVELSKEDMPGPGYYKPQTGIGESRFNSFTFNSPLHKELKSQGPGPAGYQQHLQSSSPQFSFMNHDRFPHQQRQKLPAPNLYSPQMQKSVRQISLKSRYDPIKPEQTPGPGHYKLLQTEEKNFTFGARIETKNRSQSPGPIYLIEVQKQPKILIKDKFALQKENENPSPDQYSPKRPNSSIGTVLKSRIELQIADQIPAPDKYSLDNYTKVRPGSPQFSLYSKHYPKLADDEVPSPNHYENLDRKADVKNIKIKQKFKEYIVLGKETPGPAEYHINKPSDRYQSYKAKKSPKFDLMQIPGK